MKKMLSIVAIYTAVAFPVLAQSKEPGKMSAARKESEIIEEIIKLEMEWAEASKNKTNPETVLNRILADDWFFTGPHGAIQNRAQVIDAIKSNSDAIDRTEFFDIKVRIYGGTAVATGGAREIGTRATGQAYAEEYRWMDVFVTRKGHWQAVVSQATLLPPRR